MLRAMNWIAPAEPRCPRCHRQMPLVRKIPGLLAFPDLFVFLCRDCTTAETLEGSAVCASHAVAD